MRTNQAERLLSLFISADRASAIVGDLTEEREHRGKILFWLDIVRTMFAFWRRAMTDAPLRILMLAVSGCALLVGPAFIGVAVVRLFPPSVGPLTWGAFSFVWCAGGLWTGASLVRIAPNRGMAACATLALVGETLLVASLVSAPLPDFQPFRIVVVYTTSLVVPALLLVGGAIARRRVILRGIPT